MSDPAVLYGIRSCDTVRRARRWLQAEGISYRYHDLRDDGLDARQLQRWAQALGWETLLNRRSTTWRGLSEQQRASVVDADAAVALIAAHPALLRRPVLARGDAVHAGFDECAYRHLLDHP